MRPGCGSLSVDPDLVDELRVRFGASVLGSRRVDVADAEDEMEMMFDRGWTDGLPVVPPTEERVMRMLTGTTRAPSDIVATVPPDLVEVTVEKVAIAAVMAGCKPEYLPWVLTAVEAACTDEFNIHGILATTMPVGPVMICSGPGTRAIGMNSGGNALGQGNRANSTIGRALQLVIRNVGGGRPGEVDRAAHGNPGKVGFCFAENDVESPYGTIAVERGIDPGVDALTLFPGEGPRCVVDQLSREPDSLARSLAACLQTLHHPKLILGFDAILVMGPEHARVFADAGWGREEILAGIGAHLNRPGSELVRGADGMAEGLPEAFADAPGAAEVPRGWIAARVRRRRGRICSRRSSAGGRTATSGRGRSRERCNTDGMTRTVLDPTSERNRGTRERVARPASLDGLDRGAARHLQAARQRVPRPDRTASRRARRERQAVQEADVHEAGSRRPPPRDRHRVPRRHRGPGGLRQLYVVQCA